MPTDGTKSCVLQEKHPLGKTEQAFKVEVVRLARKGLRGTCLHLGLVHPDDPVQPLAFAAAAVTMRYG